MEDFYKYFFQFVLFLISYFVGDGLIIIMPGTIITSTSVSSTSVLHWNAQRFNLLVLGIAQRALNESYFIKSMMY